MTRTRRFTASLAGLALLGSFAACGEYDTSAEEGSIDAMGDMDMSTLNEPAATTADQVDGEREEGTFVLLETAPPGSGDVAGEAYLAQTDDGTTVTIRLTGLQAGVDYVSHLHAQTCEDDDGGDHFAFDPDGEPVPPNEVHLGFTADADGTGEATVTNDQRVEDMAPAIVVHPADTVDNRLVCADFGF